MEMASSNAARNIGEYAGSDSTSCIMPSRSARPISSTWVNGASDSDSRFLAPPSQNRPVVAHARLTSEGACRLSALPVTPRVGRASGMLKACPASWHVAHDTAWFSESRAS